MRRVKNALYSRDIKQIDACLNERSINLTRGDHRAIFEAALHHGRRPSVEYIVERFRASIFATFPNGTTALHLAACTAPQDCIEVLLRQGPVDTLQARDGNGRTPLLEAAKRHNEVGVRTLMAHYPAGPVTDQDNEGRGLSLTLAMSDPCLWVKLSDAWRDRGWVNRFTPEDKQATLAYALGNLLNKKRFVRPRCQDARIVGAHLRIIETLLSQPQGHIDVEAPFITPGSSIISALRKRRLLRVVDRIRSEHDAHRHTQDDPLRYDRKTYLSLARMHLLRKHANAQSAEQTRRDIDR